MRTWSAAATVLLLLVPPHSDLARGAASRITSKNGLSVFSISAKMSLQ